MIRSLIGTSLILAVTFTTSIQQNLSALQQEVVEKKTIPMAEDIKNLVSIVEIPTTDFSRAVSFYETILKIEIEEVNMEGLQMGVLPSNGEVVSVVLVNGDDYKPSADGTIIYLNAGDDLQPTIEKIAANGGNVIVPKTEISPEMGFFALFIDTEGNKVGLHGMK